MLKHRNIGTEIFVIFERTHQRKQQCGSLAFNREIDCSFANISALTCLKS